VLVYAVGRAHPLRDPARALAVQADDPASPTWSGPAPKCSGRAPTVSIWSLPAGWWPVCSIRPIAGKAIRRVTCPVGSRWVCAPVLRARR